MANEEMTGMGYGRIAEPQSAEGLTMTPELVEAFLSGLMDRGRKKGTADSYRRYLVKLYGLLPEDKCIYPGGLKELRERLLAEGCAPSTVNSYLSAANSLLEFCGRKELQLNAALKHTKNEQPTLTREEYLRLLATARMMGKERTYLLIKVFATTGLHLRDLPRLTVEAAIEGYIRIKNATIRIPSCLREELLSYSRRKNIATGPIFVTRRGRPMDRTTVTAALQVMCRNGQVPEEKTNPRCLRKLYLKTQSDIQANISQLVEQAHEQILENEQKRVGWGRERTTF